MNRINFSKVTFADDLIVSRSNSNSPSKNDAYEFFNLQKLKSEIMLKRMQNSKHLKAPNSQRDQKNKNNEMNRSHSNFKLLENYDKDDNVLHAIQLRLSKDK